MRKALVTVSTDGLRDFVTLPSGERKVLGTISVLKFVTELTPHIRLARQILNQFLKTGEALFTIDLDRMEELLAPRRARWSSISSLMSPPDRTSTARDMEMADTNSPDALLQQLGKLEETVTALDKHASGGLIAPKLHAELRALVGSISLPNFGDQSKNDAFDNLGKPKVDTVPEGGYTPPASVTHPKMASAPATTPSVDALQANSTLADNILSTVEQTDEKIDQLVTAGRKFNASKAKNDLFVIASKVAEILNNVDLAEPWVQQDLTHLSDEANKIHSLFASAKV